MNYATKIIIASGFSLYYTDTIFAKSEGATAIYLILYFGNVVYMLTYWHPLIHPGINLLKKCFSFKCCDRIG